MLIFDQGSTTNVLECACILRNRNYLLRTEAILFNVTLCVQLGQVNTNIENCYIIVAFFVESYCASAP